MSGSLGGAFSLFVSFDASVVKWLLRSLECCFIRVCCFFNIRFTVLHTSFGIFDDIMLFILFLFDVWDCVWHVMVTDFICVTNITVHYFGWDIATNMINECVLFFGVGLFICCFRENVCNICFYRCVDSPESLFRLILKSPAIIIMSFHFT